MAAWPLTLAAERADSPLKAATPGSAPRANSSRTTSNAYRRHLNALLWPLRGCLALFTAVLAALGGAAAAAAPGGGGGAAAAAALHTVLAALQLLLGLSACFSFLACSAEEASGACHTEAEEGWLWPLGQAGEVPGQLAPPPGARPLRVVILTIGTRGDVQPFIALGQHLRDACGHSVTIATVDEFKGAVEGAGLAFAATGIPRVEQPPAWATMTSVAEMVASLAPVAERDFCTLGAGFVAAVQRPARADVILGTSHTLTFALNIGEALRVPVWLCKLAPDIPSAAVPPPGFAPSALGWLNAAKGYWYWVSTALAWSRTNLAACEMDFRRSLGLGPVDGLRRLEETRCTPQLLGFSRALLPAPLDYPAWAFQCGFWLTADGGGGLYDPHLGQVPRAARAFFPGEPGAKTACVTMGSMAHGGEKISTVAHALLARSMRVVVITGGSEVPDELAAAAAAQPKRLLLLPAAPHDWLFPLCALVVHHGGAGTTSRALAAGVPSLVIPALPWSDQPLWGELAEAAGVGVLLRGAWGGTSRERVDAALDAVFAGSRAEAPHTGSIVAEGANRTGAALRAERAAAAAAALIGGCLCKLVLPAGGEGAAPGEVVRMCQRACVACSVARGAGGGGGGGGGAPAPLLLGGATEGAPPRRSPTTARAASPREGGARPRGRAGSQKRKK